MKLKFYKFIDDLVYEVLNDGSLKFVNKLRYDGEKIVEARAFKTFYIDEKGIKHIKKLNPNWQELNCNFDDPIIFDKSISKWRVKTPEEILEELKQEKIQNLKQKAYEYIVSKYPLWKQSNDLSDKEIIVTKLVAIFNNIVFADDIRKTIYEILAGKSDLYTELVKYGIKANLIETDDKGLPLYTYYLKDGSTIIANINGEYVDSDGNTKVIDKSLVVDRSLIFKEGVDKNIIDEAYKLSSALLDISKRILWKDEVRRKVNEIEEKIKSASDINELDKIDINEIYSIKPEF